MAGFDHDPMEVGGPGDEITLLPWYIKYSKYSTLYFSAVISSSCNPGNFKSEAERRSSNIILHQLEMIAASIIHPAGPDRASHPALHATNFSTYSSLGLTQRPAVNMVTHVPLEAADYCADVPGDPTDAFLPMVS